MKKIQSIFLTFTSMALLISCTEQPYWNIPKDANGNAIITQVSKTTSPGITVTVRMRVGRLMPTIIVVKSLFWPAPGL